MNFYAKPRTVGGIDDCHFYHTMDLPGVGLVGGDWDLRAGVDGILGGMSFDGSRVLEIGPASGFLTFTMEQRGAKVVCLEVPDEPGWDFVPYPSAVLDPVFAPRREIMRRVKNSFWFSHAANKSQALLHYGDVYSLPEAFGEFDIAVMANVLLHCHSPLRIIEQCAKRAKVLIIVEMLYPELEGGPLCRLVPSPENNEWGTWWNFSTDFFRQYLGVLGFSSMQTSVNTATHRQSMTTWTNRETTSADTDRQTRSYQLFTVAASRGAP